MCSCPLNPKQKSPCQSNTDFEKIHRNSSLKIKTGNIELLPVISHDFVIELYTKDSWGSLFTVVRILQTNNKPYIQTINYIKNNFLTGSPEYIMLEHEISSSQLDAVLLKLEKIKCEPYNLNDVNLGACDENYSLIYKDGSELCGWNWNGSIFSKNNVGVFIINPLKEYIQELEGVLYTLGKVKTPYLLISRNDTCIKDSIQLEIYATYGSNNTKSLRAEFGDYTFKFNKEYILEANISCKDTAHLLSIITVYETTKDNNEYLIDRLVEVK